MEYCIKIEESFDLYGLWASLDSASAKYDVPPLSKDG
jgi:hypothetical protein